MGKNIDWKSELGQIKDKFYVIIENLDTLKKFILPVVVSAAVILFWVFGEDNTSVDGSGITVNGDEVSVAAEGEEDDTQESVLNSSGMIYVDIGGEVQRPGVYQIPAGTRLFQVIEKAGGLKESAATDSINQAEQVSDGQKIIIGSMDEASPYYIGTAIGTYGTSISDEVHENTGAVRMTQDGVMVDINKATLEELQVIPGVGPSTAQKIIDYRKEHGSFNKPEDLKKISGIGEKTYENLKDYIEI